MSWRTTTVADVSVVVTKGTTPTTMGKPFMDEGVNFIKAEALNGDSSLNVQGFAFIDEDTHESLARSVLQEDDVLVTIAGAQIGKCGYVKADHLPANTNQAVGIVRVHKTKAVPRYLYYFFKQPQTFSLIQSMGAQAAQPNLNLTVLKGIKFPAPPLASQDRIASILSAYDDLIENNTRRIALLEQAARHLYEEWFVRLRFPGREHTRIVDGVPRGWRLVVATDVIDVNPRTPANGIESILYVPMAALSTTTMAASSTDFERRGHATGTRFRNGDVLLPRITPCLENGKTAFVNFLQEGEVACGSTEFIVLRGCSVPPPFVYCLARTYAFREIAVKSMVGASGRQRVQEECFAEFHLLVPPHAIMLAFKEFATNVFQQVRLLVAQNEKLKSARDLLLPRLMSGEIAV